MTPAKVNLVQAFASFSGYMVSGVMRTGLRTGDIDVHPGEYIVILKGTDHCSEAIGGECHVVLLEPKTAINAGNVMTERTMTDLARL